jgi:hypothetical protein
LKIWDNEIKGVTEEKRKAYRRWLNTKPIHNKINHKWLPAIAKRETRERKILSWEKFISQMEYDLGKPRIDTKF